MRILIVGAGAVGGYFGARLAAAGADVAFLARGAQARALRARGLILRSPLGDLQLAPLRVFTPGDPIDRPADLVLVAVKLYDLDEAARELARHLHSQSLVLPLENGVEAPDLLAARLPGRRIAAGVAYIGAHIEAPGVIRHTGTLARLVFGAIDGGCDPLLVALAQWCSRAGIDHRKSTAMTVELWRKFVFLAPFSAITTWAKAPIGRVREDPTLWARLEALVEEAAAVGRARGLATRRHRRRLFGPYARPTGFDALVHARGLRSRPSARARLAFGGGGADGRGSGGRGADQPRNICGLAGALGARTPSSRRAHEPITFGLGDQQLVLAGLRL